MPRGPSGRLVLPRTALLREATVAPAVLRHVVDHHVAHLEQVRAEHAAHQPVRLGDEPRLLLRRVGACADDGVHLRGPRHWVQQERPEQFNEVLLAFLRQTNTVEPWT